MATPTRRLVRVTGVVQGVGFRPYVYRLAQQLGLAGEVGNDGDGVFVDVEGPSSQVLEFVDRLRRDPPSLATIDQITTVPAPPRGHRDFQIGATRASDRTTVPIPVDTGPCPDCLGEMADPDDRRHRYPFINCTNCGPRYTIVVGLPYDRPATTMAGFTMCAACAGEYADPSDRRFHAQPNACPDCGPRTRLVSPVGDVLADGDDAVTDAVARLRDGQVVAVKGVGGYHLACDATNTAAVAVLRTRKERDDKPFALLVGDVDRAHRLVHLGPAAAAALTSPARPIVLAPRRGAVGVAAGVAPGLVDLGLMLPPSPLHVLLADGVGRPLVMTSGNLAHEPIVHDDDDAVSRLGPLVDALLVHDRPIAIRCDDSVFRQGDDGDLQAVRRSRGHAPGRLPLHGPGDGILALGGHLKNTVTVVRDGTAVISHHVGDLDHPAARAGFRQAIEHLLDTLEVDPTLVAHDLHPGYASTQLAMDLGLPTLGVQHHHAHIAATMAEHRRADPVLGIAFDGLGLGPDGGLWGGEFLVADLRSSRRVGHLHEVAQPGGDRAAREPWRMAVAWTRASLDPDRAEAEAARLDPRGRDVLAVCRSAITPATSSVGRLFDAVAALLEVCHTATYEAQAASHLEALADAATDPRPGRVDGVVRLVDGIGVLDARPLVARVIEDRDRGVAPAVVAADFHASLARATVDLAVGLASWHDLSAVALGGGVFQNRRLVALVVAGLRQAGIDVLVPRLVPCNDGGLSLGQAAVAAASRAWRADVEEPDQATSHDRE